MPRATTSRRNLELLKRGLKKIQQMPPLKVKDMLPEDLHDLITTMAAGEITSVGLLIAGKLCLV